MSLVRSGISLRDDAQPAIAAHVGSKRSTRPRSRAWPLSLLMFVSVAAPACAHHLPRAEARDPLASLAWLSGSWFSIDAGSESEEHWTHPRGATMVGMARTLVGGQTQFFEYMRIEAREDGEIVLLASPKGREPAVEFTLTHRESTKAVFENPAHDFPQKISYWRDGDRLVARLEGDVGGETSAVTFEWRAATW